MITNISLTAEEIADDIQQTVDGCSSDYRKLIVDRIEKLVDEVTSNCLFEKSLDKQIQISVVPTKNNKADILRFNTKGMSPVETLGYLRYIEKKVFIQMIESENLAWKELKKTEKNEKV